MILSNTKDIYGTHWGLVFSTQVDGDVVSADIIPFSSIDRITSWQSADNHFHVMLYGADEVTRDIKVAEIEDPTYADTAEGARLCIIDILSWARLAEES